jgi:hypothetical protein
MDEQAAQVLVQRFPLQVVLAGEMRVERRPADVRGLADVGDGDRLVVPCLHQRDQGVLQQRPGADDAPIDVLAAHIPRFSRTSAPVRPEPDAAARAVR